MKMLPLMGVILLIVMQDAQDVYCSKQTGSSRPKETITHHFFVS